MAQQVRQNNTNAPNILYSGIALTEHDAVLEQDAARATVLGYGTLMAKVAASQKWVPFTDETAVDGSAVPLGIYVGEDVTAAALVAGDVTDAAILVGGQALVDEEQLIIENSKTLATLISALAAAPLWIVSVRDVLRMVGIFVESTIATSGFENA